MAAPLFGLMLILVGSMMLVKELFGIDLWFYVETYWPLVLIIAGFARLSNKNNSRFTNFFLIFAGSFMLAWNLNMISGDAFTIMASLAIIGLGISLISNRSRKKSASNPNFDASFDYRSTFDESHQRPDPEDDYQKQSKKNSIFETIDSDILYDRFILARYNRRYASSSFSGGELELYFSKLNLDFSHVHPLSNQTLIAARLWFSELNIKVPKDWTVYVNGKLLHLDDDQDAPKPGHVLRIETHITGSELNIVA